MEISERTYLRSVKIKLEGEEVEYMKMLVDGIRNHPEDPWYSFVNELRKGLKNT